MLLGTTAYLIGLLSVLVPIAIHLWSKKTRKTIPFGTIRFLKEDDTQTIKSLIPTEWWLLLLRMMLLIILVLIMSEPLWREERKESAMVLIDPAYEGHPGLGLIKDSLQQQTDVRWFSHGFPAIDDSISVVDVSYWDLLLDLEQISVEDILVISPRRIAQFVGDRPQSTRVTWVSLPEEVKEFELGFFASDVGSIKVAAATNSQATVFKHVREAESVVDSMVVTISIQSDDANLDLAAFINASIEAINEDSPLRIQLVEEEEAEWLIWLKEEASPQRRNLIFATNQPNQHLIRKVSQGVYAIPSFQLEDFLSNNFPILLEQVLVQGKIDIETYDWRELPESQLSLSDVNASSAPIEVSRSLASWLWSLLVLILLFERFLSLKATPAE